MSLVIAWRTTKLIEGGHRGLQAYRPICYYFYVFTFLRFFSKSQERDFLRFFAVSYVFSNNDVDLQAEIGTAWSQSLPCGAETAASRH